MPKLQLTLACWNYDRTRALLEGRVTVDGVDLNYLNLPVEETFFRMLRHREFDVAEMSLSSYTLSLFRENPPFIAIPVFPSRMFRHSCIYVHAGSGIREPKDLIGKRVGSPEYQMTAPVWIRGILSDEYGVPVTSPSYFTGGEEQPGRPEKIALSLPPEFRVETDSRHQDAFADDRRRAKSTRSTRRALRPHLPRFGQCAAALRELPVRRARLLSEDQNLPDHARRRDPPRCLREHRWVAQSLYKAFALAQRDTYEDLHEMGALKSMLPWLVQHVEDTEKLMGRDFWPYGLEANVHVLETFLRYSHEQGLAKRLLAPAELFAPESLESFKI